MRWVSSLAAVSWSTVMVASGGDYLEEDCFLRIYCRYQLKKLKLMHERSLESSRLSSSRLSSVSERGVKGQANDIQLMVNRQARSTTGCYKSTNTGALVAEAGLRPATSLLDNRQRRFGLRLAGLPSSDQARCVVGHVDGGCGPHGQLQGPGGLWS